MFIQLYRDQTHAHTKGKYKISNIYIDWKTYSPKLQASSQCLRSTWHSMRTHPSLQELEHDRIHWGELCEVAGSDIGNVRLQGTSHKLQSLALITMLIQPVAIPADWPSSSLREKEEEDKKKKNFHCIKCKKKIELRNHFSKMVTMKLVSTLTSTITMIGYKNYWRKE